MLDSSVQRQVHADSFYDVPAQRPDAAIALRSVRVHNQHIVLDVEEELLGGARQLLCAVEAEVSLRAEQRGVHMSRMEQAFQGHGQGPVVATAMAIAERIRQTQRQDSAWLGLRALAPVVTSTPVTMLASPTWSSSPWSRWPVRGPGSPSRWGPPSSRPAPACRDTRSPTWSTSSA